MRMKKKLAAFLCMIMCVTSFAGCSAEELGYLSMVKEMSTAMEQSTTTGSMEMVLDFDVLKDFAKDVAKATDATAEDIEMMDYLFDGMDGKETIKLTYRTQQDMKKGAVTVELDAVYNDKAYDFGTIYMDTTNGYFITGAGAYGGIELYLDLMSGMYMDHSYIFSQEFKTELKAVLTSTEYIQLFSMADMGYPEDMLGQFMDDDMMMNLYDGAIDFYLNALSDFSTNAVTKVENGYSIELNGDDMADLVLRFLTYIAENPERILGALKDYMMEVGQVMALTEEELVEMGAELDMLAEEMQVFTDEVNQVVTDMKEVLATDAAGIVLDAISYKYTLLKEDKAYISDEIVAVTWNGQDVLRVTSRAKMQATKIRLFVPANYVSMNQVAANLEKLEDKYNPVRGAELYWFPADQSDTAYLSALRADFGLFSGYSQEYVSYEITEDGRLYLPLRAICDVLGEDVQWDNAAKIASVVTGGESVPMEGMIVDSRTYIKVRDFEKLGYTVEYLGDEYYKYVSIMN